MGVYSILNSTMYVVCELKGGGVENSTLSCHISTTESGNDTRMDLVRVPTTRKRYIIFIQTGIVYMCNTFHFYCIYWLIVI